MKVNNMPAFFCFLAKFIFSIKSPMERDLTDLFFGRWHFCCFISNTNAIQQNVNKMITFLRKALELIKRNPEADRNYASEFIITRATWIWQRYTVTFSHASTLVKNAAASGDICRYNITFINLIWGQSYLEVYSWFRFSTIRLQVWYPENTYTE